MESIICEDLSIIAQADKCAIVAWQIETKIRKAEIKRNCKWNDGRCGKQANDGPRASAAKWRSARRDRPPPVVLFTVSAFELIAETFLALL